MYLIQIFLRDQLIKTLSNHRIDIELLIISLLSLDIEYQQIIKETMRSDYQYNSIFMSGFIEQMKLISKVLNKGNCSPSNNLLWQISGAKVYIELIHQIIFNFNLKMGATMMHAYNGRQNKKTDHTDERVIIQHVIKNSQKQIENPPINLEPTPIQMPEFQNIIDKSQIQICFFQELNKNTIPRYIKFLGTCLLGYVNEIVCFQLKKIYLLKKIY